MTYRPEGLQIRGRAFGRFHSRIVRDLHVARIRITKAGLRLPSNAGASLGCFRLQEWMNKYNVGDDAVRINEPIETRQQRVAGNTERPRRSAGCLRCARACTAAIDSSD